MVVPLAQCVAHPDEGTTRHFLIHHPERVANAAGAPDGSTNDRLAFLAGLLHDAAKCHVDWQEYIDPASSRKKGPPHSPMGAALFTFVAERLIPIWHSDRQERLVARDRMLNWLMAINGHHGRLGDFHGISLPWMKIVSRYSVRNLAAGCDLAGVFELVKRSFPEFQATAEEFTDWLDNFDRSWVKLVDNGRRKVLEMNPPHEVAMRFPLDFSRLIIADRLDAGNLADDYLQRSAAVEAITSHSLYCNQQATQAIAKGASHEMVELRRSIQHDALDKYREYPRDRFFTLLLPTGYGKTLTSLRIALDSAALGQSKRLIYVAPYLSILSQAANEIAAATRIAVFQHHHLSLAAMASNGLDAADGEQTGFGIDCDDDFEILDTWKVPILAKGRELHLDRPKCLSSQTADARWFCIVSAESIGAKSLQVLEQIKVWINRIHGAVMAHGKRADHQISERQSMAGRGELSTQPRCGAPVVPIRFQIVQAAQRGCHPVCLLIALKPLQHFRQDQPRNYGAIFVQQRVHRMPLGGGLK